MLLLLSFIKAICEVVALTMLGQGLLFLITGARREQNFVYGLFRAVTKPFFVIARLITPRVVLDRHIWMVALFIVLLMWLVASQQKLERCRTVEGASQPLCEDMVRALKQRESDKKGP